MAETLTYTAPNGDVLDLKGSGTYVRGIDGRFMPSTTFSVYDVPGDDGQVVRGTRFPNRLIQIPWTVTASGRAAVRTFLRNSARTMRAHDDAGTLTLTPDGGSAYTLAAYLEDGLEGGDADGSPTMQRLVLRFRSFDPYWQDASATNLSYPLDEDSGLMLPWPPINVSPSTIYASVTIDNDGDAEAWPVWTIEGPGSNLVLTNATTGESLAIDYDFAAGEFLEIDTRPGHKSVTIDGVNAFQFVTGALWPLAVDANNIDIGFNAADANTAVGLSYRRRWVAA